MTAPDKKKRGLGRGLSALLSDEDYAVASGAAGPVTTMPLTRLRANPHQPRTHFSADALDDLVASVKEKGVLTPLIVRPVGSDYEIIAGERRWRAAQRAGVHELPVVIRDVDDREALEMALVENVQRADLTPIEEARGYRRLMDEFGYTQDQLSRQVGKSRSHVANMLRLMSLPDEVQKALEDSRLSMGHARALIGTDDPAALARLAMQKDLSVRQVEALARSGKQGGKAASPVGKASTKKDADTRALEAELADALGLSVSISHKGEAGKVELRYRSLDQLDLIAERLMNKMG
ncbi:MAG: ParB/RepB/Spo0J family partition protein [Rhodothalassiaceae bacterium]